MSTVIRLKRRRNSNGIADVKLHEGEPYYDMYNKKLYIGNMNGSPNSSTGIPADQLHIAQVKNIDEKPSLYQFRDSGNANVGFRVGEAEDNIYQKTVNNVAIAKGLILDSAFFGEEDPSKIDWTQKNFESNTPPNGTVYFKKVTT